MNVIWKNGRCSIKDLLSQLPQRLAYTTVETTLNRLYLKGLLGREKRGRRFIYSPRTSLQELIRERAARALADLLSNSNPDLIVSFLVEAIATHDLALLDGLEARIREHRLRSGS